MSWYKDFKLSFLLNFAANGSASLSPTEYERRLEAIGWRIVGPNSEGHKYAYAPDGINSVRYVPHKSNWDRHMHHGLYERELKGVSPGLAFVWKNPFRIPHGFNPITLKIEKVEELPYEDKKLYYWDLFSKYNNQLERVEILDNGEWKVPALLADDMPYIMFRDESDQSYKPNEQISLRYFK